MGAVSIGGKKRKDFSWADLGNIKEGRINLGEEMPVLIYRLMQYTILDVLTEELGAEKSSHYFRKAGHISGMEFARNVLDLNANLDLFLANLQKAIVELKIGILRIESVNGNADEIIFTVGEDLECSGLPISDETVCNYDEGFFAGIFEVYTGKSYSVSEIDCWANGDRVCRFKCTQNK